MLRALWGGPETVIVISSDLSHYHPHEVARALDDQTIADIAALHLPIHPRRACGAYPINGLLDVLKGRKDMRLFELGCSTSGRRRAWWRSPANLAPQARRRRAGSG